MRYGKGLIISIILLMVLIIPMPLAIAASGVVSADSEADQDVTVYSGSGFFVTPNLVLTCNHIVRNARNIKVVYNDDTVRMAVLVGSDHEHDIAVLKVSGLEGRVQPLSLLTSSAVRQGSRVFTLGFPLPTVMGTQAKLSEGIISCTAGLQGDTELFQISNPVQPGNSGSPLLNEEANVIGIITGGLDGAKLVKEGIIPQNVNYAVKIESARNLLIRLRLEGWLAGVKLNTVMSGPDIAEKAKKAVVMVVVER